MIGFSALRALNDEYKKCSRCPRLCASRTQPVFGTGSITADIVYVGGAPAAEEDAE